MSNLVTIDLTVKQGSDFQYDIVWNDDDGNPQDLTDYTARMKVKQDYTSSADLLSLTSPGSGLTITALTGTITISISDSETAAIAEGNWVWDLELVSPSSEVFPVAGGRFILEPEVTK